MPFYRYTIERRPNRRCRFAQDAKISLAGNHAIQRLAKPKIRGRRTTNVEWHIGESELVTGTHGEPGKHAVIIGLKPSDKKCVSLYRLRDIWGCSQKTWTPLLLRLDALFVDFKPPGRRSIQQFKREFDWRRQDGKGVVFEFLYVNGGTQEGDWNWGTVGRANGALLWSEAFQYFVRRVFAGRAIRDSFLQPRGC